MYFMFWLTKKSCAHCMMLFLCVLCKHDLSFCLWKCLALVVLLFWVQLEIWTFDCQCLKAQNIWFGFKVGHMCPHSIGIIVLVGDFCAQILVLPVFIETGKD